MKIKDQAKKLHAALLQCTRGALISFDVRHAPQGGFNIYASRFCGAKWGAGTYGELANIDDLTLDNVPYILARLSSVASQRWNMTVTATVKPRAQSIYTLATCSSRAYRISSELANVLHESALRYDNLTVTNSTRISEISFCDYIDVWQYTTLDDD